MPNYENVYLARPDVSAQQVEALTERFTQIVAEQGGKVTKNEYWGLRSLSYRIRKNRKAHYSLLNIDAPPAAVKELERNMRINEDVIRYLTVLVEALEEGPSAMMQSKSSRDDRPRGGGRRRDRDREDEYDPAERAAREAAAREPREPRAEVTE